MTNKESLQYYVLYVGWLSSDLTILWRSFLIALSSFAALFIQRKFSISHQTISQYTAHSCKLFSVYACSSGLSSCILASSYSMLSHAFMDKLTKPLWSSQPDYVASTDWTSASAVPSVHQSQSDKWRMWGYRLHSVPTECSDQFDSAAHKEYHRG